MSSDRKDGSSVELPRLDFTGRTLKQRIQKGNAKDPYDSSRTFSEPAQPIELFRRRRQDSGPSLRREREKRVKFEIVQDITEGKANSGGGYNPYEHNR